MARRTTLWIAAALLGIVATVAVAWSASRLAGQHIGLSAEPSSVAARLAPKPAPALPWRARPKDSTRRAPAVRAATGRDRDAAHDTVITVIHAGRLTPRPTTTVQTSPRGPADDHPDAPPPRPSRATTQVGNGLGGSGTHRDD